MMLYVSHSSVLFIIWLLLVDLFLSVCISLLSSCSVQLEEWPIIKDVKIGTKKLILKLMEKEEMNNNLLYKIKSKPIWDRKIRDMLIKDKKIKCNL